MYCQRAVCRQRHFRSCDCRYRGGSHSPDLTQCRKLAAGIAALAAERGLEEITRESVESAFRDALTCPEGFDRKRFCHNLNELLDAFSIGNTELARYLSYDASYLSRIRSGQRTPRDTAAFALSVGRFVARRCQSVGELEQLGALIRNDTHFLHFFGYYQHLFPVSTLDSH